MLRWLTAAFLILLCGSSCSPPPTLNDLRFTFHLKRADCSEESCEGIEYEFADSKLTISKKFFRNGKLFGVTKSGVLNPEWLQQKFRPWMSTFVAKPADQSATLILKIRSRLRDKVIETTVPGSDSTTRNLLVSLDSLTRAHPWVFPPGRDRFGCQEPDSPKVSVGQIQLTEPIAIDELAQDSSKLTEIQLRSREVCYPGKPSDRFLFQDIESLDISFSTQGGVPTAEAFRKWIGSYPASRGKKSNLVRVDCDCTAAASEEPEIQFTVVQSGAEDPFRKSAASDVPAEFPLRIISPSQNTTVKPGQTIDIRIQCEGFHSVFAMGENLGDGFGQMATGPNANRPCPESVIPFTIPTHAKKDYKVSVMGIQGQMRVAEMINFKVVQ